MSFKNKRISSLATNSAKKEEVQQSAPSLMPKHQASLRGSLELLNDTTPNYFSPLNKNLPSKGIDELISVQNAHNPDKKFMPPTPKMIAPTCSIISTNQTHIKVITHQSVNTFGDQSPEQNAEHYIALNECVNDVMTKVQEKGRVVKTTQKKKYILNALNAPHMRVASIYVVVLDNNVGYLENPDLRATLMSDASNTSSNTFNQTLTKL